MTTTSFAMGLALVGSLAVPALADDDKNEGDPPSAPPTLFENVTAALGLSGQRAKDIVLTDLNGDGWLDLVADRRRMYVSDGGTAFRPFEDSGLPFPTIKNVKLAGNGKLTKGKTPTREYVPLYLYFADVDNDGDQDAIYGVQSAWEFWNGREFAFQAEADHGLRSTVFLNDGSGAFKAAPTSEFSAKENARVVMALAICDVDRDGHLDLFEGSQYRVYGASLESGVDRLWRGAGNGKFVDATQGAGLMTTREPGTKTSSRPTYGVTHADIDNDGDQDLLALSYGRQWNRLWRNDGAGKFTDVGQTSRFAGDAIRHGKYPEWAQAFFEKRGSRRADEAPFRSNGNTFDCAVGDIDNDGDLDLFLGEITHAWAGEASDLSSLLVNNDGAFEHRTADDFLPKRDRRNERSWNNGDLHVAWLDYDNDTRLDLLIGSGDYPDGQFLRLYRQEADGTFTEVTEDAAFAWEGCGSLSIGDFDRDGGVDIVAGRSFARLNKKHREKYMDGIAVNEVGVFRNRVAPANGNHWLNITLTGRGAPRGANRDGIGARIEVTTGELTQIREIRAGSGLSNHQDALEAAFGLGAATSIDRVVVRWNDAKGDVQTFENVPIDTFVTLVQGAKSPVITPTGPRAK